MTTGWSVSLSFELARTIVIAQLRPNFYRAMTTVRVSVVPSSFCRRTKQTPEGSSPRSTVRACTPAVRAPSFGVETYCPRMLYFRDAFGMPRQAQPNKLL